MATAELSVVPVRKAGLTEMLVAQLLGLVTAGTLKPGDQLPPERRLAETFHVSRPTLREAIRALSVLGVLEIRHGGGVFVSQLEASDLLGPLTFFLTLRTTEVSRLYEARQLIEGKICALAAQRGTDADFDALEAMIETQNAAKAEPERYRAIDTEFHRRLAELADNEFLGRAAQSLNILGLEFRKTASETPSVITRAIQDHKAIVAALRRQDASAARAAMATHMNHVLMTTQAAQKEKQEHD